MNRIDERLKVMNVDTSKMSKEQKFSAATGLTFYNEKLEKNGWYVPGGAANVSTEADSPEEEKTPVVSPDDTELTDETEQTDENVTDPAVESTDETEQTDAPVVEPTDVTEQTETTESVDEPVTDPVVDPTPSEIEIETQP